MKKKNLNSTVELFHGFLEKVAMHIKCFWAMVFKLVLPGSQRGFALYSHRGSHEEMRRRVVVGN